MKVVSFVAIMLCTLPTLAAPAACVGDTAITRESIGCRSGECGEENMAQLGVLLFRLNLDHALKAAGLTVTVAEEESHMNTMKPPASTIEAVKEMFLRVAEATLAVMDGGDAGALYEQALEPRGIDKAMFDHFRSIATTRPMVTAFMKRDIAADLERDLRADARSHLAIEKVASYLSTLSVDESSEFWRAVFAESRTVVFHPEFQINHLIGALKRHEVTIDLN